MNFFVGITILTIGIGIGSFYPQKDKFKAVWNWFSTKYKEFKNKE